MKLQNVLKNIIILIALILLINVLIANILFTANISNDEGEVVTISINNIWSLLLSIVIGLAIYLLGYFINKIDKKYIRVILFITTAIVILQKRQNLSNEILLSLIMFIGGFLFHIIWEAKSRYVISYIIMLMPIVGVHINKN